MARRVLKVFSLGFGWYKGSILTGENCDYEYLLVKENVPTYLCLDDHRHETNDVFPV